MHDFLVDGSIYNYLSLSYLDYPSDKLLHYKHFVFGSKPNLLTFLLYTSYISLNSLKRMEELKVPSEYMLAIS